ncbi:Ser/Thr protein phosphatase [Blastomyces dermatitidis ATCC 18188]|uniref:Ser/Thr protein phosphatase n=1 Tax=Ajellomyces dermatitidis (strain ATCC 18188 / CBS 674.68) TaxID=653446 RepID=F2TBV2_AJEDA|nr:Ser/Thr protein phosphatase [Blastomyces dermatitidis ATCC 18188]
MVSFQILSDLHLESPTAYDIFKTRQIHLPRPNALRRRFGRPDCARLHAPLACLRRAGGELPTLRIWRWLNNDQVASISAAEPGRRIVIFTHRK